MLSNTDKRIKLECKHYYLEDHFSVLKKLNQAKFYVDSSIYEGFGLTPVEATFLDKTVIASDTFIHREILGEYPLYFKRNNLKDLKKKMEMVIKNDFSPNKEAREHIKKKYSNLTFKNNIMKHIDSLL